MERRFSVRMPVDAPLFIYIDGIRHPLRIVDLSATGMLCWRGKALELHQVPEESHVEIFLGPGSPISARVRSVWQREELWGLSFVLMHDADRLTVAEHLDRVAKHKRWLS